MEGLLSAGVFSFQLKTRQPGEGSSLEISDLNSSIKYKGGVKTRGHCPPWNEFDTCDLDIVLGYACTL